MRIPFDSFVLAAVVSEVQKLTPARVQDVRQPNDESLLITLYGGGRENMLLLSCHPEFGRVHLSTRRVGNRPSPSTFLATVRSRIGNAGLTEVRQIQGDRVLELVFESDQGVHRLIAELMGKHSNLILVDAAGRVVTAAKMVGQSKSSRPILIHREYQLPPVMQGGTDLKSSPFYRKLADALGKAPEFGNPVLSPGNGAYPCSVAALGLPEHERPSISVALEQHFERAVLEREIAAIRGQLLANLDRVILARETAIADLRSAEAAGGRAPEWQRLGELILAYGPAAPIGSTSLQVWDYDGTERTLTLDGEKTFQENANAYFDRAKRAKGRLGMVRDQIVRLSNELELIQGFRMRVEAEERLDRLRDLKDELLQRRYVNRPPLPTEKEDRPYEGHRVRELVGPGGWTVLYGENAEANDYLTVRVAKPNDWWLHVRGSTSAHVVIVTRNQPDKVQPDLLRFAAKIAVMNSPSKHAGYVPVDYTLKKYVRKPKGAPKGTAFYTHEKTLHVESD